MTNEIAQTIYQATLSFFENKGIHDDVLTLYYQPNFRPESIEGIYKRLLESAMNRNMMPMVIYNAIGGRDINLMLGLPDFSFNPHYLIHNQYFEQGNQSNLCQYWWPNNPIGNNHNLRLQFCKAAISGAHFLADFEDHAAFYHWADEIIDSQISPTQYLGALPLLKDVILPFKIAEKVEGYGFALACDFLKEIGYVQFPKPDSQIISIFRELHQGTINILPDFIIKSGIEQCFVFYLIKEICNYCNLTAYKMDKLLWLGATRNFHHHTDINGALTINIPMWRRRDFINHINAALN